MHTDFSGGRSGGLVFPFLSWFPTVYCDPHTIKVCGSIKGKGFGIVNKAKVDVFLELFWFLNDPTDVGNLISGPSAFSKSSLNIWKFSFHVLLKPQLENFEPYFAIVWDECNCAVIWTFFHFALLWNWNGNWPFPVLWPLLSFSNLLAYWVQHFNSIIFIELEIAQLEFHQLSLFLSLLWCFLRPTWLRTLGCLALGGWSHHHGYLDNQLVTLGETKLGRKWKVITGKYC